MFGSKTTKNETAQTKNTQVGGTEAALSTIAAGMTVHGNVESSGDVRIEGRLIGNLVCKARVVVGKKGRVEGSIDTVNATIAGEVKGTLLVRDLLQLQDSARVMGETVTLRLAVQDGAVFTGHIEMGHEAKEKLQRTPTGSLLKQMPLPELNLNGGEPQKASTN
jgi:cytoskeletal protein CcmA (bactofilin family)